MSAASAVTATTGATAPRSLGRPRIDAPDVVRAIALIGVVVMNYHGYLNGAAAAAGPDSTFGQRLFDPWQGVLSTRFAATFVLIAGVGITLLTERSRAGGDPAAIADDRVRLVRRGAVLYLGGLVLDWIWPGTIIFFYGAFFVAGALLFTLRTRTILVIGGLSIAAAAAIQWWAIERRLDGRSVDWLFFPRTLSTESPRGLLLDTVVNGTHPVLPWLAFLCVGIVVGRLLTAPGLSVERVRSELGRLLGIGLVLVAGSYLLHEVLVSSDPADAVRNSLVSTRPFDRGPLYVLGAIGTSLVALAIVWWLAERASGSLPVRVLAVAGRTTLTLYVAHVFVFNLLVNDWEWVRRTGLDTALVFAGVFWVLAIAAAWVWSERVGQGPLERWYRRFGG